MHKSSSLLDDPVISQRVFYPQRTRETPSLVVESGGFRLGCHVLRAHPEAGWVVYFHGNGEMAADCEAYLGDLFADAGVNVCFAEYRGYGSSTGRPALAAMLGDGEQVVAALGVPPERIAAFGRSLGSLYAIELARRLPQIAGVVLESGIAVLTDLWPLDREAAAMGCTTADIAAAAAMDFDHQAKLGGYHGPLLVLHAAGDRLVNRSHGERLHAWGGSSDKRLVMFPQGDHNTILDANYDAYVRELRTFFQKTIAVPINDPFAGA